MPRARNIKPGFYKNEDLAECSIWARFIFPGLWMLADREGRLEDRPKRIKGELLPFDSQDMEPLLAELASKCDAQGIPFIVRYRNSVGSFIQISKFKTHQSPHYSEKASAIKPRELPEIISHEPNNTPGELPENSGNSTTIKRGSQPPDSLIHRFSDSPNPESIKKHARKSRSPPVGFSEFYAAYPKKVGRQEAEKQWNLLNPDESLRVRIMTALEEQKQSPKWSDRNYIKDPERWLKYRRWEDEVSRGTELSQQSRAMQEWLDRDAPIEGEAHEHLP